MKAKLLGRRLLDERETLVTSDTLLAWHRKLIAQKWTYARTGPGRPRLAQEIADLVLSMFSSWSSYSCPSVLGALSGRRLPLYSKYHRYLPIVCSFYDRLLSAPLRWRDAGPLLECADE